MDIAALSMGFAQMNLHQQAGISVMKMAMDKSKTETIDLIQQMMEVNDYIDVDTSVMEQSINPHLGANIDIRV